ncbi:Uncharacterised protein [Mycobacteroides abscessus subsp. abscessus]|nr:Uncharacterised protein [Mycobacteroides abscessus subsp. abscessus]
MLATDPLSSSAFSASSAQAIDAAGYAAATAAGSCPLSRADSASSSPGSSTGSGPSRSWIGLMDPILTRTASRDRDRVGAVDRACAKER